MNLKENRYELSKQIYREGERRLAELPDLEMLQGCTVCVVGCTGLIGTTLLNALLEANTTRLRHCPMRVIGVARNASWTLPHHLPGFQFVQASVTDLDLEADQQAGLPTCDYMIYIAGTASDYLKRRNETIETQVVGLERFLMHATHCRGFVYISSTRVYGRDGGEAPITEQHRATITPMHTDNLYDSCKHLGESLCLWHALNRQIPVAVARLTNVYGPPNTLRSETALTDFVRQAATKGEIILQGHPDSVRNQCCVLDIAQGILKVLTRGQPGQAYNIGSHHHLSTHEMAQCVGDAFSSPVSVYWPQSGVQPSIQYISIERAVQQLGYAPTFTFAQLAALVVTQTLEKLNINR